MDMNSEITALIYKNKEEFEANFKKTLMTDSLRNTIMKSVPVSEKEEGKLNDPEFRLKFNQVLSPISQNIVNQFQNVSQFDTGNLFTAMVTSISDSVSLESAYRTERIINDFRLGRVVADEAGSWRGTIYKAFESMDFSSPDIKTQFTQNMIHTLSVEEASEVIDGIKNDVKNSVKETEAKNNLVEGTTKEIIDYKKEIAPPDDQYVDAENPDDTSASANGDTPDDTSADNSAAPEDPNANLDPSSLGADDQPPADGSTDNGADDGLGADPASTDPSADPLADPNATPPADTPTPEVSPTPTGTSTNIGGGITINITAPDLKTAKEGLNLFTAESFCKKYIPLHNRTFNEMKLPDVKTMASECVNVLGDARSEIDNRLLGLRYSIAQGKLSKEDTTVLMDKLTKLTSISNEAYNLAQQHAMCMSKLGLTQNGLYKAEESSLFAARNIIGRFLTKTKGVSPYALPYTSRENIMANAFDIVQLRQDIDKSENPDPAMVDDLISRESVFYKGMIDFGDKKVQEEATAVIDLSDMKFEKALTANFITDYRIKAWEQNVGKDQKDTNAEVTKRVKEKFETLWSRPLNEEELQIVAATTNGDDATEIIPTPYEKFLIKLSKEAYLDKSNESGISIGKQSKEDKENLRFKAKMLTTVFKTAERFNLINPNDIMEFENFCGMFGTGGYIGG